MKNKAVFGIVRSHTAADVLARELQSAGFGMKDISVLAPNANGDIKLEKGSKAPEGAVAGATAGGALGGTLGLLAGIGLLVIPGIGPFIAAGPIMAALSGAAIGAAVGSLTGSLVGLGIPEVQAKLYETRLNEGGVLVSVHTHTPQEISLAKATFEKAGATDISSTTEGSAPSPNAPPAML